MKFINQNIVIIISLVLAYAIIHLTAEDLPRTLYSLRHTYATFQIFNGVDYHTLSKNLGTSIGMLEKHYSHLTPTLGANKLAGKRFPDLSE